jgi:hypothetical protein
MAARVAAELKKERDVQVETIKGGLGEFSVTINNQEVIATNRLWYPNPTKVVNQLRDLLSR